MHARIGWQNLRKSEFLAFGDYYLITGTDFKNGQIDFKNCYYVAKERYAQDKNIQVHNGSILITKDGTLGKVAFIKDLNKPATLNAGVFNVMISSSNADEKFIFQYLAAPFLMDYVNQKATGGTIKHLNQNILVDFPVILPELGEQHNIGELFSKLDYLITLRQRKLEKLKKLKKSLLQRMFPENGCAKPELRFAGFTDVWKQRKFGKIVRKRSEATNDPRLPRVEYEDIIPEMGIFNKDLAEKDCDKQGVEFQSNDVLYGKLRPYLHNWLMASFNGIAVGDFWVLEPQNIDSRFLYRLIQSEQFDKIANQSTGTKMPRADWPLTSNTEFFIPASTEEQKEIGVFFLTLDKLITLHQRKLETLNHVKKALLDTMFI